jgi:hypothetical protein
VKRYPFASYVPAVFCAFLSLMALAGLINATAGSSYGNFGEIPFVTSLPFCFYLVGAITNDSRREIQELRQQIIDLKQQGGN